MNCFGPRLFLLFLLLYAIPVHAQHKVDTTTNATPAKGLAVLFKKKDHTFNYNAFNHLYPIRDNPTMGYRSSYNKEKLLVDVHPVLLLSLFENFEKKLKAGKLFSMGYYFSFRPQFRMYKEQSTPVKMPSYKVLLGFQHLYRISRKHLLSYAIESGHYSNGQSGSAFTGGGKDGTPQSDSVWATINKNSKLSALINRTDGDFSTNLTELTLNYRYIPKLDAFSKPKQVHSFSAGMVYYHNQLYGLFNAGGNSDRALDIYGRWRFLFSYAFSHNWQSGYRVNLSENIEAITGTHPSVDPLRSVTQFTFFLPKSIGFFVNYIYGHDDYNLRFVDSGHQFGFGLTWDFNPPLEIGIKSF